MDEKLQKLLAEKAAIVNDMLKQVIVSRDGIQDTLAHAMEYTLLGGGKKLRPVLTLLCCELIAGNINDDAITAAAAVEMVHTYSLVHDDLPAMDDDDLRRGRPTCHKKFDEATAILAGDGLLTLAFEILAGEISDPKIAVKLITVLGKAAGAAGMIAGQADDLKAEKSTPKKELVEKIHLNKTAKMFAAATSMGAIAAKASSEEIKTLEEFGLWLGLGFQIADDILDVTATSEQLGKTAGKDEMTGKATYPAVFGIEKSKQLLEEIAKETTELLKPFGQKADTLKDLTTTLTKRTK